MFNCKLCWFQVYNASSLRTFFSSLARYLSSDSYHTPVDLANGADYQRVRNTLKLRCRQVTSDGQRPGLHAAKAVEGDHITDAWTKGNLGRDNPQALVTTVQLVIQSNMGVRAITECHSILNKDIIEGPKEMQRSLIHQRTKKMRKKRILRKLVISCIRLPRAHLHGLLG